RAGPEDAVHGLRAALDDGSDLFAVDQFGYNGALMADQPRDLLQGHVIVGQERHEAVAQLPGCPLVRVYADRTVNRSAKVAADVGWVQRGAVSGSEHQPVVLPAGARGLALLILAGTQGAQRVNAPFGQGESPPGFARLGVTASANRSPHCNV